MKQNVEKMLLHICCGPCGEYPTELLKATGKYDITLFFYNPNIHPEKEWYRRLEGAMQLAKIRDLKLLVEEKCEPKTWCAYGRTIERCAFCYEHRLNRVAEYAQANDFDVFTTTLLVSPYQNHELIHLAGQRNAEKYGVSYLAADFTEGFRKGQQMAREDGLYRQKYCGCAISLADSDFQKKIIKQQAAYQIPVSLKEQVGKGRVVCL